MLTTFITNTDVHYILFWADTQGKCYKPAYQLSARVGIGDLSYKDFQLSVKRSILRGNWRGWETSPTEESG